MSWGWSGGGSGGSGAGIDDNVTASDTTWSSTKISDELAAVPEDSGWIDVTYAPGWSTYTGSDPVATRKIGSVVYMRGTAWRTDGVMTNGQVMFDVHPAHIIPGNSFLNPFTKDAVPKRADANTAGQVKYFGGNETIAASQAWINFSQISWPL